MALDFQRVRKGLQIEDQASFQMASSDPSTAGGLAAEISSLSFFNDGGVGKLYVKEGAADTAWELMATQDFVTSQVGGLSSGLLFRQEELHFVTNDTIAADDTVATHSGNLSDDEGTAVADPADGDYVIADADGTPVMYKVVSGVYKTMTSQTEDELGSGEMFSVVNYLPDTPGDQENRAIVVYTGSVMAKIADVDFAFATGIDLSGSYTPANGDVAAGDSVEEAIQKLDGSQEDILTGLGIANGDVDLGTFAGSTITDNSSVKTALQELETALEGNIGADVTPLVRTNGLLVAGDPVNDNLDKLDNVIGADADITAVTRTAGQITVDASNSIFNHIDNLDAAIGADVSPLARTTGATVAANDVNANIDALDDAIGVDITNTTAMSTANSVNANLDALADHVDGLVARATATLTTTDSAKVIYSYPHAGTGMVSLMVQALEGTDGAHAQRIDILFDAANSEVDWNEHSILGETLFDTVDVSINGANIEVKVDSATAHATADASVTIHALQV